MGGRCGSLTGKGGSGPLPSPVRAGGAGGGDGAEVLKRAGTSGVVIEDGEPGLAEQERLCGDDPEAARFPAAAVRVDSGGGRFERRGPDFRGRDFDGSDAERGERRGNGAVL